jgi:DHA1 family bicyclomycin/chloramphenicol resistance-like MFS transporter
VALRMVRRPMKRKEYRILILILGSLATLGPFSVDMYLPGFPAIAADLHTDIAHVGLSLTSFFIGISLGQLFYGPFIDRYGRKKPLVGGLILFIIAALGCSIAPSIQWLVGMRFFLAVGGCVGMVAGRAVIRDLFPIDRMAQVLSLMMMLGGVAPIIAPVMGGMVVATFGWRFLFYLLTVIAVVILTVILRYLPESKGPDASVSLHPSRVAKEYFKVFKEPAFLIHALIAGTASGGFFSYISGSPFVFMKLLGLTETQFGLLYGINALSLIGANMANRMVLKKYDSARVLRTASFIQCGVGILLLVGSLLGLIQSRFVLIPLIFCLLFFSGFVMPNTIALALAPFARNAGSASALVGGIQMIAGALASIMVSLLHDGTVVPMVLVMASCSTIGLVLLRKRAFSITPA